MKMKATSEEDQREVKWAMRVVAKKVHGATNLYQILESMHVELDIIREILTDDSICMETPIAHIVPRDPTFTAHTMATPHQIVGWSEDLSFWWTYTVSPDLTRRITDKKINRKRRVTLDALKMVGIIINFAASIHTCWRDNVSVDDFPVLLNACDGLSANAWVNYRCKTSMTGRTLGRLFVGLLMGTKIGIQAACGPDSKTEGSASLCAAASGRDIFDFRDLIHNVPSLSSCRQFQPSRTLLGLVFMTISKIDSLS